MYTNPSLQVAPQSFVAKLLAYKWQLLALGMILFAIFRTNGGILALRGFGRILVPLILGYIVLKFVQNRLKKKFGGVFAKVFEAQRQAAGQAGGFRTSPTSANNGPTATLVACPKCGVYAASGHICQK